VISVRVSTGGSVIIEKLVDDHPPGTLCPCTLETDHIDLRASIG